MGHNHGRDVDTDQHRAGQIQESQHHDFPEKLEIGDEIEFAGHIISHRGIKPDLSKFQAIRDFPAPKNIKELRSYMGLANQLSSFIPDLQQCTSNMRKLLSPKNE